MEGLYNKNKTLLKYLVDYIDKLHTLLVIERSLKHHCEGIIRLKRSEYIAQKKKFQRQNPNKAKFPSS